MMFDPLGKKKENAQGIKRATQNWDCIWAVHSAQDPPAHFKHMIKSTDVLEFRRRVGRVGSCLFFNVICFICLIGLLRFYIVLLWEARE